MFRKSSEESGECETPQLIDNISQQGSLTAAVETKYLKDLILKLEDSQTAESIKCVVDCRRLSDITEGNNKIRFWKA